MQINKNSSMPLYQQVKEGIVRQILNKEMLPGFRLPAERVLAEQLGVHRNTIKKAYQCLILEEYAEVSQKPRGYFVKVPMANPQAGPAKVIYDPFEVLVKEDVATANSTFNKLFFRRKGSDFISFEGEIASPETYPKEAVQTILRDLADQNADELYAYSDSQGVRQLRESICGLLRKRQIHVNPSEIQIVTETTQTLLYIIRLYLSPGDSVVVESPLLLETYNAFALAGVNPLPVAVDEHGMVMEHLRNLLEKHHPRLIYTVPNFHTPTAVDMSVARRQELLDLSYQYGIPIIEEDCTYELRFDGPQMPTLKAMDTQGYVIYSSSFLYSMFPGIRLGYFAAPKSVISRVSGQIKGEDVCLNSLSQYLAAEFIRRGDYEAHNEKNKSYYQQKRDIMVASLRKIKDIPLSIHVPRGATNIWLGIPPEINQSHLLANANRLGVGFIPGYLFYPNGEYGGNHIRLSYSQVNKEKISLGIQLLHKALQETLQQL